MALTQQIGMDAMADTRSDHLMTRRSDPHKITFTPKQLEALETVFPELSGSEAMTEAQIRHRLGQRSVIAFIRDRVAR